MARGGLHPRNARRPNRHCTDCCGNTSLVLGRLWAFHAPCFFVLGVGRVENPNLRAMTPHVTISINFSQTHEIRIKLLLKNLDLLHETLRL